MPLSNIQILHQDAAVLVVNKPTLLLSVPAVPTTTRTA
jgi:tRNA pseudouridine32 synthase/23S rRNA pseudouridine746 synthase